MATIGRIDVYPNGAATVPGEVNMVLDLRASHENSRDEFLKQHKLDACDQQNVLAK